MRSSRTDLAIAALLITAAACNQRDDTTAKPPAPPPPQIAVDAAVAIAAAPRDAAEPTPDAPPPADLLTADGSGATLDVKRDAGAAIERGTRGGGDNPCGGGGRVFVDGPAPGTTEAATPPGRITISDKQAFDESSLTPARVVAIVQQRYIARLKRCYKDVLRRDAGARGRLTITFTVNYSGRVVHPRVESFSDDLSACVTASATAWTFDRPKDADGEPTTADFLIKLALVPD